jgi:hypothetical protein
MGYCFVIYCTHIKTLYGPKERGKTISYLKLYNKNKRKTPN